MTNRKLRLLGVLLLAVILLSGCNIFRRARPVQAEPPPPFKSPIAEAVGYPGMSLPEITRILADRNADTRSILGQLSIIVGEARRTTRMQFDANMYFAPPDFLRVRGSADAGTLFDFLMQGDQVQVMLVPEKKVHLGTLGRLRANPTLMAGIQPDDLMYSFLAEQNLYRYLSSAVTPPPMREENGHFVITVVYASGITEHFSLRTGDLLIDKIDRYQGRKMAGSVRFDSYDFYPSATGNSKVKHLLPSRFEAQLPSGAVATVEARDLQPNAKRDDALTVIEVPPDFQQLPL